MTDLIDSLEYKATAVAAKFAGFGALLMLVIALLTILDILMRWLFSQPIAGFNEIFQLIMAVAISAAFPAAAMARVNLRIEILQRKLTGQQQYILIALASLLLLVLFVLLALRVGIYSSNLHQRSALSLFLQIPLAPFFALVTGFLSVAVLCQFIIFLQDLKQAASRYIKNQRQFALLTLAVLGLMLLLVFLVGFATEAFVTSSLDYVGIWVAGLFILLWIMTLAFIPIAVATALTGLIGAAVFLGNGPALSVLGSETAEYLGNSNLAVLPLFLMMGGFAVQAGLAADIYRLAQALFARFRGGLAMATIGGCAGFGALTGSSIAATATIGQVALPEMKRRGYPTGFSAGCVAAGGTLGLIVPPSTAIILYAILTEESIGRLFIAAIVPAILTVFIYLITVKLIIASSNSIPPSESSLSFKEIAKACKAAAAVLLIFIIVIGGLYGGIFTATESAAVGVFGTFVVALMRGKLKGELFWDVLAKTTSMTAMIYLLIIGAVNFAFFIAVSGLPELFANFIEGLSLQPILIVAILLLVYILLGSVMDPFPIMIITVPIIAPIIGDMGYSLIWWGIIMVCVIETGMITPPFGINVFVLKKLAGDEVSLPSIFIGVLPFVLADLIKIALLVLFPALVLWLPSTM